MLVYAASGIAMGRTDSERIPAIRRWDIFELSLERTNRDINPYADVTLEGRFTAPSKRQVKVPGFYDGGQTWRLRLMPDEPGLWRYEVQFSDGKPVVGTFRCAGSLGHGSIRIHPANPYAFAHADGTPFFPMGDTCYGLYADSPITPELRSQYLRIRRSQRFNFVRMGVLHSPVHWETDAQFWPWGGTPQKPDLDRLNVPFFRGLDKVLKEMRAVGMNAELILLNFYQWPFTDTRMWTAKRERLWLSYLTARYSAFSNIFLWTIANEYETHPDGVYRLDMPADPDWVKTTARFIKQHDPYRHPVTVHPVISASTRGGTPGDPYDPPWRIGEFFGKSDALDVLSQQTGQAGEWDEKQQCWRGNDPNLVTSLHADRRFRKPVLNTESGYEYLRDYPTYQKQVHHTDKVRRSAWRVVCGGGYMAAGFAGTLGMSDFWNRPDDASYRYSFVLKDEGAARQLALLYRFWAAQPFWRMQPYIGVDGDAVALAEPGKVYIVYLPQGGKAGIRLGAAKAVFAARWFDPRTGRYREAFEVESNRTVEFHAPDRNDWVLHLSRKNGS